MEQTNNIIEQIAALVEQAEDGNISTLEVFGSLKKVSTELSAALKQIQEQAITEAETYGKGEHSDYGFKFQVKSAAGRYSYKHLPWYDGFKAMEEEAKEAAKAAQKGHQFITEDGEVVEPAEYSPGATTISIKFK